jgi:hypothetical protein
MYLPSLHFQRTPLEKSDPFVSWARSDQDFFAAGACHILAFMFIHLHPNEGFKMVHIRPKKDYSGNHVYATNGEWAFDHNGWTLESELLDVTKKEYRKKYPKWDFDKVIVEKDFETYCIENNHRTPSYFAFLPWERAYNYIKKFDETPSVKS